ncbi:MAG: tetratricopeptide repeat protein, partial [Spirochaetales bacterium]|nr:tetratricopeptide repeat protein [Spirochaetales bacterium]
LERAASGQAPQAGAAALGEGFFDHVVPVLFVARLDSTDPGGGIPGSGSYLRLLQQAEAQNRSSVLPPYLQGRIHELEGRPDQAAAQYRRSIRRTDSFYPGQRRLAVLLIREGRPEEAIELLQRSAALLPDDLFLRYSMAEAYYQAGKLEDASSEVARVLLEEPDHPAALLLRARVFLAEGKWTQALRLLHLLRLRQPDSREAWLLSARVLYEEALDPEGALKLIGEAQTRFPGAPEFHELAGRIHLEAGRTQEALDELQLALDLQPGRVSTLRLLLEGATRMRRWLQAAIHLSEILEQERSGEDLLKAIEIYRNLGDSAQVLHYAEQLYQSSCTVENLVVYARALLAEGQTDQAAALIEGGLQRSETPALSSALLALKAGMIEEQAPEEAMALLREALLLDPLNYEALVTIAGLYVEQGELRKAGLYLEQAIALDPDNAALRVQLQNIETSPGTRSPP